jgi:hypothetical protein
MPLRNDSLWFDRINNAIVSSMHVSPESAMYVPSNLVGLWQGLQFRSLDSRV